MPRTLKVPVWSGNMSGYTAVMLPYGVQRDRYDEEYYRRGRRAVLRSYDLRGESFGFKERLKQSVKGINETAERLVLEVREGAAKRRIAIRVLRAKAGFSSWLLRGIRCFAPCSGQKEFIY